MDKNIMPDSDEEKIAHFFREVGREFDRRIQKQNEILENERKKAIERAKKEIENELKSYKTEKIREFMFENSRKASREILDLKHESLSLTEEILNETENKIKEKLVEFVNSEKYYEYLLLTCREASGYVGEGFELYMSPDDCKKHTEKLSADLEREFIVIPDERITIGGARLCRNDIGITVDATLDEKLADKIEELAKTGI